MNINEFKIPENLNLTKKELRDFSKKVTSFRLLSESDFKNLFNNIIYNKNYKDVFDFFIENKFIEHVKNNYYCPTTSLSSLSHASLSARKSPEKAWNQVALALIRVVALSQAKNHNWCGVIPTDFFIFGSMLNPLKKDYGDADVCIGKMFCCERNEQFQKTQKEWLKNYRSYIPTKALNSDNIIDIEINQQILMIKNSEPFLSIHDTSDPSNLSSKNKDFPILKIWEYANDLSIDLFDKYEIKNRELSINWKNNNPREAKEVIQNLNNALTELGLPSISSSNFKEKCRKYYINILASDLIEELHKFNFTKKIFDFKCPQSLFDYNIKKFSNIVLSGELGFEALGIAFRKLEIPNDHESIQNYLKTHNDHYIEQTNFSSCFHNGWNSENSKLELENSKNKVIKNIQLMRKSNTAKKKNEL